MGRPSLGDVIRKTFPVVVAGLVAAVALGVNVGRAIDRALESIGRQ
jgi:hypothetical protein